MAPDPAANRFDLLRLMAALAVFWGHAEILWRLHYIVPFAGHSLGSLAVYVFFFISGFLVQQSWQRDPHWGRFWLRRGLRIFPGLMVAVAFSVLLGAGLTSLPARAYWAHADTWRNLLNNMAALATVQTLPGVFEGNPFARAVNGSLWTIRYELMMYLALALLGSIPGRRRWIWPAAAVALACLWSASRAWGWDGALERMQATGHHFSNHFGSWWAAWWAAVWAELFRWGDFCAFGLPFFLGSSVAARQLRVRGWMAAAALGAALLAWWVSGASLAASVLRQMAVSAFVACGVFYLAHAGRVLRWRWRTDLSYGVYIYAFPLQQAAVELGQRHGWPFAAVVCASLGATLLMAFFSWHVVERPAIDAARRLLARRRV